MSKGLIFKIFICGFVVFLLLPAVFDEDEARPVKRQAFEDAVEFNPSLYDGEESLPILDIAEPEKGNIFTRYAKKFKRMYGQALFGRSDKDAAPYEEDGNEELYYAMAALFNAGDLDSEDGEARAAYAASGGAAEKYNRDYFKGVPSTVKQTVHDNVPVRGLYEASAVESYETRSKAKEVYSNVMNKVDKTVPSAAKPKAEGAASSSGVEDEELYQSESVSGINDGAALASLRAERNDSKYSGIAGRRGGSYNSYGVGSEVGLDGFGGALGGNFEAAAARAEKNISAAAGIMRDERREQEENGSAKLNGNIYSGNVNGSSLQSGAHNETLNGGAQGGGFSEGGSASSGSSGAAGNNSNQNNPPLGQDTLFDQQKYDYMLHTTCEDDPISGIQDDAESLVANGGQGLLEERDLQKHSNPDKIEPFCARPLEGAQSIADAINGKNIVVDLGLIRGNDGDLYRVIPTFSSLSSKGLGQIGIMEYYDEPKDAIRLGYLFKGANISEFASVAKNDNSIVITVSPVVARAYLGRSVLIEEGDLESKRGLKALAEKLNNLPAERARILALTARQQEAGNSQPRGGSQAQEQARKKAELQADIEGKKEEVKGKGLFGKMFGNLFGGDNEK